jgi:DNA-binding PadR family transcriptional regulator
MAEPRLEILIGAPAALLLGLRDGPAYGLDLIGRLAHLSRGGVRLRQATVYPALTALERRGLARSWTRRVGVGRPRSYFELTVRGVGASERVVRQIGGLLRREARIPEDGRAAERVARALEVSELSLTLLRSARPVGGMRG